MSNSNARVLKPDIHTNTPIGTHNTGTGLLGFLKPWNNTARVQGTTTAAAAAPTTMWKPKPPALHHRSLSEPNSSVDLSRPGTATLDYLAMVDKVLQENELRFIDHAKEWVGFQHKYQSLFANGQPVDGKLVKKGRPMPTAQTSAKELLDQITERMEQLEQLDLEEALNLPASANASPRIQNDVIPERSSPRKKKDRNVHEQGNRTIPQEKPLQQPIKPWVEDLNVITRPPVKYQPGSAGTWHAHPRNAITPRAIPDFNTNVIHAGREPAIDYFGPPYDFKDIQLEGTLQQGEEPWNDRKVEKERNRDKTRERERDRGRDKERERDHRNWESDRHHNRDVPREREKKKDRAEERDKVEENFDRERGNGKNQDGRKTPQFTEKEQEKFSHRPRPRRERQISDPADYTQSRQRRHKHEPIHSPAPAVYTLVEDSEVADGSVATTTTITQMPERAGLHGVPRIPTVVAYPGDDILSTPFGNGNSGRAIVNDARPKDNRDGRRHAEATDAANKKRRQRSRSLGHELEGQARRRSDSRSPKRERERARTKERDKGKAREQEPEREREREKERDRQKQRDRDREKEKEKEKDRYASLKSKQRDRDRYESDNRRERDYDREHKYKETEKGKIWYKEKPKDKDRDRGREKDRERDRDRGSSSANQPSSSTINVTNGHGYDNYPIIPPSPNAVAGFGSNYNHNQRPSHEEVSAPNLAVPGSYPPRLPGQSRFVEMLMSPAPALPEMLPEPR